MLISMDGPPHTRLRRLVSRGFTPKMLDTLESQLRWRTDRILDAVVATGGEVDFVSDVAELLPLHVIADIIGIPEAERPPVFEGTNAILRAFDPESGIGLEERLAVEQRLFAYASGFNERKRQNPVDDIWSALVQAEVVDDDGTPTRLTEHELDLFFFLLAAAGSETTRNAISDGLLALVEHPAQLARLRDDPELMVTAVEEILRWSSPVSYFRRTATRDVEIGGEAIGEGDVVTFWHPSANRDEYGVRRSVHLRRGPHAQRPCLVRRRRTALLSRRRARRGARSSSCSRVSSIASTDWEVAGEPGWSAPGALVTVVSSLDHLPVRLR